MSLRRLDEFAFVYEKVASYANFRASFSSVLIMAEESSHSQDLNNAFIIERTPTKGTKRKKYTLDFKCKVIVQFVHFVRSGKMLRVILE